MTSLSYQIGLESLQKLLKEEIKHFHLVLWRREIDILGIDDLAEKKALAEKIKPEPFYFCLTRKEIILVDVQSPFALPPALAKKQPKKNKKNKIEKPVDSDDSEEDEEDTAQFEKQKETNADEDGSGDEELAKKKKPSKTTMYRISFASIEELVVHYFRETRFLLVLDETKPDNIPSLLQLSTCYRKEIIENISILYGIYSVMTKDRQMTLPVRFAQAQTSTQLLHAYEHPAEQFFHDLPHSLTRGKKIFYRCGYLFMAPASFTDTYLVLPNRPTSSYILGKVNRAGVEGQTTLQKKKHLVVRFMTARPLTNHTSLTRARDIRGCRRKRNSIQVNENTEDDFLNPVMSGPIYGNDNTSDLDFFLWTESVARAVAIKENLKECGNLLATDYFIVSRGPWSKKMNVTGDKASWSCFRIHLYIKHREIAIIGARRKFIPPLCDMYQDMVFVLYGPYHLQLKPNPNFMEECENIVSSLSPAVTPIPYRRAQEIFASKFVNKFNKKVLTKEEKIMKLLNSGRYDRVHPTYYDRGLLQARINTLLFDGKAFAWLNPRSYSESVDQTGDDLYGIWPRAKFIEMECNMLGKNFCRSLIQKTKFPKRRTEEEELKAAATQDVQKEDEASLENPLNVIFRMEAEYMATEATASAAINMETSYDTIPEEIYIPREEWNARVAMYLAFCVDGGMYPGILTIKRLIEPTMTFPPSHIKEVFDVVDQVVDFLLYMKPKPVDILEEHNVDNSHLDNFPKFPTQVEPLLFTKTSVLRSSIWHFESFPNILYKLHDKQFMKAFTCNEDVMIRIITSGYIQCLERRCDMQESVVPYLLCSLLQKDYNLHLIQAACEVITTYPYDDAILVGPLIKLFREGSVYAKIVAARSLATLATVRKKEVETLGGLGLAMWNIYVSKSAELLEACVEMIMNLIPNKGLPNALPRMLLRPDFPMQLVQLIRYRCQSTERYPTRLLALISALIIKMSTEPSVLSIFLKTKCHVQLMAITVDDKYDSILLQVTAALGSIFYNAGPKLTGPASKQSPTHCTELVLTLQKYTNASNLQLCLNLLIALKCLVTLHTVDKNVTPEKYERQFMKRVNSLRNIVETYDFTNVLDRCNTATDAICSKKPKSGEVKDPYLANSIRIAEGVRKKIQWFRKRLYKSSKHKWEFPKSKYLDSYIKTYSTAPYN